MVSKGSRIAALSCAVLAGVSVASPVFAAEGLSPEEAAVLEERIDAMQLAIVEANRIQPGQCLASRPELCEPMPECDAQGRRPLGGVWNCTLVWKKDEAGVEKLAWVDGWEVEFHRLPSLGSDGQLR